ncbi:MAG TPA: hypothetical protein PK033_07690 [Acetivibrio sp.]|jgi:glycosyltransferase involved in cell wall biosynthesis|nr:hypothetical protein [Clostridium sp.]HOQ37962.1 hypothetical protein [Acetivibrio sp.]HPT91541.1 hypothetical protein [Acetivibrio sp.]HQA57744.1 hypothetical protein [Acetivibrio sp.]
MLQIVLEVLVCVLAAYGLIILLHELLLSAKQSRSYKNSMVKLVLIVKNQGETIEGVLRNVLPRDFIRKLMPGGKLIVLDMGSKDDTMDILRKLERDYECLEVLKRSEMEYLFKCFEDENERSRVMEHVERNT